MNISKWLDNQESKGIDVSQIVLPNDLANDEAPDETIYFKEINTYLTINKVYNENGLIMIDGKIEGVKNKTTFRVTNFTNGSFTVVFQDKDTMYNYRFVL